MPDGQEGNSLDEAADGSDECAAKVESCIFTLVPSQDGQLGEAAWKERTSFSNLLPQSSHRYS